MEVGDLVRITRTSLSVPRDTIGLIVKARDYIHEDDEIFDLFHVQLMTKTKLNGVVRRYLPQDLRRLK